MRFEIYHENMERLENKLAHIQRKCEKHGTPFSYKVVDEIFKKFNIVYCGHKSVILKKFYVIETEGIAIYNDWEFVATVENLGEGNVIKGYMDIEIPERYYTCKPVCEHCNTNRYRKYTYLIHNKETGEFKQVGKTCLMEYTNGLSAEMVANHISMYDELIEGGYFEGNGNSHSNYYDIDFVLNYAAETIRHFGYTKTNNDELGNIPTVMRVTDFISYVTGFLPSSKEYVKDDFERCNFDTSFEHVHETVQNAIEWINNQERTNTYISNLKSICESGHVTIKNFGLLVSLIPTYEKTLRNDNISNYVGNIGEKVNVEVNSFECVFSTQTQWGYMNIYKIIDTNGNIFIWKTNKDVEDIHHMTAKIKDHSEYNGVKQNEVNYCKVID